MRAVLVALFAFVALVAAQGIAQPFTHHAVLDNVQAGTNSSYFGAAIISSDGKGNLHYTIVNNVPSTTQAHIHGPALIGVAAGIVVTIPGFNSTTGLPVATGVVAIPQANWDDLNQGRLYFNIHTVLFPGGEIRGQILAVNQQITQLTGTQDSVVTSATGVAFTSYNPSNQNFTVVLTHNVQNATLAHVHGPAAPGATAAPILTIAGDNTTASKPSITFTATLTAQQVGWLQAGLLYYNVHSTQNPNGEIRGQILPIINLLSNLDGHQDNVTTAEQGVGMAGLYGTELWTLMVHNVPQGTVTASHIHQGAVGVSGPVIFPYTNPNATAGLISQNFTASASQATDAASGNNYFNIHTVANPNGEIRGQIYTKQSDSGATSTTASTGTASGTTGTGASSTTTKTSSSTMVIASMTLAIAAVFVVIA